MSKIKGMLRKLNILLLAAFVSSLTVTSCSIKDDYDDCGVWLEFIFDYNMEFGDVFEAQIDMVDVYVFDADGKFLFRKHSHTDDLSGRKRMFLSDGLSFGRYQIIAVGGFSRHFTFSDREWHDFVPGETSIEEATLSLNRRSEIVDFEFPHVWYAPAMNIDYKADNSVWPVRFIRETNKFSLVLESNESIPAGGESDEVPFTFEITAPEGGFYDYRNDPILDERVTYKPYSLAKGEAPMNLAAGKLNTMRLLSDYGEEYRLIVRATATGQVVWDYDLLTLLKYTMPDDRPQIGFQEYLDRQGFWNIVILHKGGPIPEPSGSGFVALRISVNGWIIWLNEIEA